MMAQDPSVITVSGPDRAALLTDLTLRFGRIDVVGEREVLLPGGDRGFELTVRHRPFTDALPDADELPLALELDDAHEEEEATPQVDQPVAEQPTDVADPDEANRILRDAQVEVEHLLAQARGEAEGIVAKARGEAKELLEQAERERQEAIAQGARELREASATLRASAQADAKKIVEEAETRARALQAERERELAEARAEGRVYVRDARDHAEALLREARAQADLAMIEGRALAEAVRDAQHQVRALGGQLTQRLQEANKDLTERTSLHGVQARLRAQGAQPTAVEIAEHLAQLVGEFPGTESPVGELDR